MAVEVVTIPQATYLPDFAPPVVWGTLESVLLSSLPSLMAMEYFLRDRFNIIVVASAISVVIIIYFDMSSYLERCEITIDSAGT